MTDAAHMPDATPPSAPIPAWGVQLQLELQRQHSEIEELKSATGARNIAIIELLGSVASEVKKFSKRQEQIWGAIAEIRKAGKRKGK